jgi:hypothetical protein
MADVKISGLPGSTVPLAGTEVLPIVQGGATKQVSIANVTAGRSIAALSVITPTIQAETGSAGGTIKNGSGVAQMQWGSGGASNLSLEVATNINPANAAVSIAPTGTGTVTINPATASTMNNVAIGGTTPLAGNFTTLSATGVATMSAGTAAAPAITTTGDTNTGIFFPAADTIAFTEGGAEAMRINSSGDVIVGGTVANAKFNVVGITNTIATGGGVACFNNEGVKVLSGAASGVLTTVATLTKPVTNSPMRRIVFTVTSTNDGADAGYSVACSVREVLMSNYGGLTSILKSTELSNNQGSINAGVINVALTTAAAVSGSNILLQATATITGAASAGLTASFMTKVEIISSSNYQDITFA